VRRIARELVERAIASAERRDGQAVDDAVHDVRKRCKKVRALLRLARGVVGKDVRSSENDAFRDIAHNLSAARDAQVMLDTLEGLRDDGEDGGGEHDGAFARCRQVLVDPPAPDQPAPQQNEPDLAAAAAALRASLDRIDGWPTDNDEYSALSDRLRRTYTRGRAARRRALRKRTDEAMHEWRKRAKDLWYHTRLLKGAWPKLLQPAAKQLSNLTDLLGDGRDLSVLRSTLLERSDAIGDEAAVTAVLERIDQRRRKLHKRAKALSARIYAETPAAFAQRMNAYWKTWRKGR
jgi:CHAD domain-containing protein